MGDSIPDVHVEVSDVPQSCDVPERFNSKANWPPSLVVLKQGLSSTLSTARLVASTGSWLMSTKALLAVLLEVGLNAAYRRSKGVTKGVASTTSPCYCNLLLSQPRCCLPPIRRS